MTWETKHDTHELQQHQSRIMTAPDYYAEAKRLEAVWLAFVQGCTHDGQHIHSTYNDGRTVQYCIECSREAQPLAHAYRAAYKAARKRQLADMPRCCIDGCKRRAAWEFPFDVSLCGLHKRKMLTGHSRACSGMGFMALIAATYDRESMLRWAATP